MSANIPKLFRASELISANLIWIALQKLQKAYDEMRDSYLQLKEQYSNLFKENQRLKDAGHTYEGTHIKNFDSKCNIVRYIL